MRLVSGGADETVRVWDAKTGKCEQVIRGHGKAVTCVAVAPDGKSVVSGSQDTTLRLWSLETGAAIGSPVTGHLDRYVLFCEYAREKQKKLCFCFECP